jgi:hypothetical protein
MSFALFLPKLYAYALHPLREYRRGIILRVTPLRGAGRRHTPSERVIPALCRNPYPLIPISFGFWDEPRMTIVVFGFQPACPPKGRILAYPRLVPQKGTKRGLYAPSSLLSFRFYAPTFRDTSFRLYAGIHIPYSTSLGFWDEPRIE